NNELSRVIINDKNKSVTLDPYNQWKNRQLANQKSWKGQNRQAKVKYRGAKGRKATAGTGGGNGAGNGRNANCGVGRSGGGNGAGNRQAEQGQQQRPPVFSREGNGQNTRSGQGTGNGRVSRKG
ncbi:MAG: hypothetical protein AAFV80_18475, partial [Bacteroidota bacterium]